MDCPEGLLNLKEVSNYFNNNLNAYEQAVYTNTEDVSKIKDLVSDLFKINDISTIEYVNSFVLFVSNSLKGHLAYFVDGCSGGMITMTPEALQVFLRVFGLPS